MNHFRSVAFTLLALGGAAVAAPAAATDFRFDLTSNENKINGTYGNARTFSSTVGDTTLSVTATGWQARYDSRSRSVKIDKAFLGSFSHGLGVTGSGDNSGRNNYHQIDNSGSRWDFVLLQFDKAVTLKSISRYSFGLPGGRDDDASIAWGSSATPLDLNGATFPTDYSVRSIKGTGLQGSADTGVGTGLGNVWMVAADFAGAPTVDGFKLGSVTADYIAPPKPPIPGDVNGVPEPGTWLTMLLGFGGIGAVLRRRRAVPLPASC